MEKNLKSKKGKKIYISKEFPFIMLFKMISLCGIENEILKYNGEEITVHKFCALSGTSYDEFDASMIILQQNNLCNIRVELGKRKIIINVKLLNEIKRIYKLKKYNKEMKKNE